MIGTATTPTTTTVYATIGARGGRSTSAAKAAAARENGRRGGRPKGTEPKQVKSVARDAYDSPAKEPKQENRAARARRSPMQEPKRVSVRGLAQRIDRVLRKKKQRLSSLYRHGFRIYSPVPFPRTAEETARDHEIGFVFPRHFERVADIEVLGRELGVLKNGERLS